MKSQSKRVKEIAQALAFGSAALDDEGLQSYLKHVTHAFNCDIEMGRSGEENRRFIEAARLAIDMRNAMKKSLLGI